MDQSLIRPLLDAIPSAASLVSAPELIVIAHNRRYQELFDEPYRSHGAVGVRVDAPYPEEMRPYVIAAHTRVRDGGSAISLRARALRCGSPSRYDIHVAPFHPPGTPCVYHLVTFWDATDRTRAEHEASAMADSLRRANEQLTLAAVDAQEREAETAAVLSAVTEGVVVHGDDGRVLSANPSAVALFGFDPVGETVDALADRLKLRDMKGAPAGVDDLPITRVVHGMTCFVAGPFVITGADGGERVVQVAGAPARLGGRTAAVCAWRDLTERERLMHELAATNRALGQADRRKDEFLAILSHELRNPLAAVTNAVYVLEHTAPLSGPSSRLVEIVGRQTKQLTRMVDDLLDVSRITQGRLQLRRERIDLRDVVARAIDMARVLLETTHHELDVSLHVHPLIVDADPARLEQVIANLLSNAAKYTPAGGRVAVQAVREGGEAVVHVTDTGIGMTAETLSRIFDLFAQADHSLVRSQGGLGIGLTLARRLMDLHGGTVEGRSEGPGRGSEFVVRLPALADASDVRPAEESKVASHATRRKLRVLVVDDKPDVAQGLADLVRLLGHEADVVHDGAGAIRRVTESGAPDVVLLDIGLPDVDGFEVARRLRATLGASSRTRLIAVTGYGQAVDQRFSQAAGFDDHFIKPVDAEKLRVVLGSYTERVGDSQRITGGSADSPWTVIFDRAVLAVRCGKAALSQFLVACREATSAARETRVRAAYVRAQSVAARARARQLRA